MARIMVVDDDHHILRMIEDTLSTDGHQVALFWDPKLARKALQVPAEALPSVIILDVMMPGLDGYSFLQELQANDDTRAIPVLVMSANHKMVDMFRHERNVFAFMEKPFNFPFFRETVARAVGRS